MSADLLARLIEAGTPAALVGEVAMALASAAAAADAQIAAAMQPTKGALRMRRMRERNASSRSVTCDAGDAQVTVSVSEPSPTPSPSSSPDPSNNPTPAPTRNGNHARTRGAAAWPCPDGMGIDPQHWADVMANRKSKRLANTPTALAGIMRELEKLSDDEWPPGRIIQHAAERGWGAIFDPRPNTGTRNGQRSHHDRPRSRGLLGAVFDAEHDGRAGAGV